MVRRGTNLYQNNDMKKMFLRFGLAITAILSCSSGFAQYALPSSSFQLLNAVTVTNGYQYFANSGVICPFSTNFAKVTGPTLLSAEGSTNLAIQMFRDRGFGLAINYSPYSNVFGGLITTLGVSQDGTTWVQVDPITNTLAYAAMTNFNAGLYGSTASSNNYTAYTLYPKTTLDNVNYIRLSSLTNSGTNGAIVSAWITLFP